MSKTESDGLKKISTKFLKEHKYYDGHRYGTINWSNGWSENKSSVSIYVSALEGFLKIYYSQTNNDTGIKKDFDYKIPLTSTPCNYGNVRYWFICPWYKNGNYCGRRVGTLYKDGDYFACRHCYNLTYSSRNLSGFSKRLGSITAPDVDKAKERVKRISYNGKFTRKYLSYLKKEEKLDNAFVCMAFAISKNSAISGV